MARWLIQSRETGRFLVPDLEDGTPGWVDGLREAGGGVVADLESAIQLMQDNCDMDDMPVLVDLDRLGTAEDYPVVPG